MEKLRYILSEWFESQIPALIPRSIPEGWLNTGLIVTLAGVRRSGKTYLFYQMIKHLGEEYPRENTIGRSSTETSSSGLRCGTFVCLRIFLKLVQSMSDRFSYGKWQRFLRSIGFPVSKNTLIEYMGMAKSAFMCEEVPIFSYSVKNQLQYPRKVYLKITG